MRPMLQIFAILLSALLVTSPLQAAPSAELWQKWTQHDANSSETINHDIWNSLLNRYVTLDKSNINLFAYKAVSATDRQSLKQYLNALSEVSISRLNRDEQRAYWINLYNALTINVILDYYPVRSIRDISSGLFSSGPWAKELIRVEGETLTLDDIEHRILRPIWQDPRLHYAVNCASIGCPNLQNQAFTASNTESLLEKAAREYINHERGANVSNGGKLIVSSIYKWFGDDFGGEAGVIAHLKQYARPELSTALQAVDEIDADHYDWSLNGLTPVSGSGARIGS